MEFDVQVRRGTVVEAKRWSDTHVSGGGGGGGGYLHNGSGFIHNAAVSISSTVVQRCELFIKDEAGGEFATTLNLSDFPIRQGHRVSFVSVARRSGKGGAHWAGIYNHDLDRWIRFDETIKTLAGRLGGTIGWGVFGSFFFGLLLSGATGGNSLFHLAMGLLVIWLLAVGPLNALLVVRPSKLARRRKLREAVDAALKAEFGAPPLARADAPAVEALQPA